MPRRSPPTPLRLVDGPIPPRNRPKHTLPSRPHPVFHPVPYAVHPRVRARSTDGMCAYAPASRRGSVDELITIADAGRMYESRSSSPVSASSSSDAGSRAPSPLPQVEGFVVMRGPWDHSSSIKVPFDVKAVLTPPQPAVVNPGLLR